MGDWTYNTDHGRFCLPKKNLPEVLAAVREFYVTEGVTSFSNDDLSTLLAEMGLELFECENGDIGDIYLSNSSFSSQTEELFRRLAPFVEDGSYLVFYGTGTNVCWALSFQKNPSTDKVELTIEDTQPVLEADLKHMLQILHKLSPLVYNHFADKYSNPTMRKEIEKS